MKKILILNLIIICFLSCKKNENTNVNDAYYFPSLTSDIWEEKIMPTNWDATKLQEAFDYAATKATYGLIVLHHGKIVKEQYWNGWDKTKKYPFNSASKSIVATIVGIAQQGGLLNINNKTSDYLGNGWTSLPLEKENQITLKHQLSMTTGLEDAVADDNCMIPTCLTYKADAGTRWAYHNAPYRLLQNILAIKSGKTFTQYANESLLNKIGINGAIWYDYIMYATTRDAAKFGSFILQKGNWNGNQIITNQDYFIAMTNTSQNLNLSYGYLWWLNGKTSAMVPTLQTVYPFSLATNAPADMVMALGKDDKKIYVIPSLDVVVARLGDNATGNSLLGPSSFDNELWGKLKLAIKY